MLGGFLCREVVLLGRKSASIIQIWIGTPLGRRGPSKGIYKPKINGHVMEGIHSKWVYNQRTESKVKKGV